MIPVEYKKPRRVDVDLSHRVFDDLIVNQLLGSKGGKIYWECVCVCGNTVAVSTASLVSGNTKSCGCRLKNVLIRRNTKHNMSRHIMYGMWRRMLQRCSDEACSDYKYYGARGITVCERWKSFENFYSDIGDRPEGMSLDRIDNNGPYSPENCRWATRKEQMQNTRSVISITYNGETHSISEWERQLGFKTGTLKARLTRLNYTVERAFLTPVRRVRATNTV